VSWRAWAAFAALGSIWGIPTSHQAGCRALALRGGVGPLTLGPWFYADRVASRLAAAHWDRTAAILAFSLVEFVVPFAVISIGERWIDSSGHRNPDRPFRWTITLISRFFGVHERLGTWRCRACGRSARCRGRWPRHDSTPLQWAGVGCMLLATVGYAIGPLNHPENTWGPRWIGPIAASLLTAACCCWFPSDDVSAVVPSASRFVHCKCSGSCVRGWRCC